MYNLFIAVFAFISLFNPFVDISIGRCVDSLGNGKEYNGEAYYNYISYKGCEDVKENDIIITGFILNRYGECEYRIFDKVILQDAKGAE